MNFKADDISLWKQEASLEKQVISQYKKSLSSIQSLLGGFFTKYADGNEMTYADAAKFNRLARLELEMINELKAMGVTNKKAISSGLASIYDESYYRTAFQFEKAAQAALGYGQLKKSLVVAAIQNPISGLTLNERLEKNRYEIIMKIKEQLVQGLIRGDSYPNISRALQDVLEKDAAKATRLVQTEANRVLNAARGEAIDTAQEAGVKGSKIWVATLDDATRDTHGDLDGEAADEDGLFWVGGYSASMPGDTGAPEEDINCRCTTRFEITGYGPEVRRIRGEGIVSYKTWKEWKNAE